MYIQSLRISKTPRPQSSITKISSIPETEVVQPLLAQDSLCVLCGCSRRAPRFKVFHFVRVKILKRRERREQLQSARRASWHPPGAATYVHPVLRIEQLIRNMPMMPPLSRLTENPAASLN